MEASSLRVAVLVGEPADRRRDYLVEIKHELAEAGHSVFLTPWFMPELRMKVPSITGRLKRTEADVWIVLSAAKPLLAWFGEHEVPVFALFGHRRGLPIAESGPTRRQPLPKPPADSSSWVTDGLRCWCGARCVCRNRARACSHFSTKWRLRVPEDVSLVCTGDDSCFTRCRPSIAHIGWDTRPVLRRAPKWANNLASGKRDVRPTLTRADLVEGGTIGPAPGAR